MMSNFVCLLERFHVSFPGLGIHDLPVSRVAFDLFGTSIYFYSLCIYAGVMLGLLAAARRAAGQGLTSDEIYEVALFALPLLLLGARLYYVAFEWDYYRLHPASILNLREGGLAFYGGVLGGMLAVWIVARRHKRRFVHLLDFLAPFLALGQAVGRWGNFFNQEAFGTNTQAPWGMISEETRRYLASLPEAQQKLLHVRPELPVHPTFFYEFIGNLLIFFLLRRLSQKAWDRGLAPGLSTASYLVTYGLLRFFVEGIRTDALYIGATGLRVSQLLSAVMVLTGAAYLTWRFFAARRGKNGEKEAVAEHGAR